MCKRIVDEFQEFIRCRGETEHSLKKRFGISPSQSEKSFKIFFKSTYAFYAKEDIAKVLEKLKDTSIYKKNEKYHIHRYPVLWSSLKKKSNY